MSWNGSRGEDEKTTSALDALLRKVRRLNPEGALLVSGEGEVLGMTLMPVGLRKRETKNRLEAGRKKRGAL